MTQLPTRNKDGSLKVVEEEKPVAKKESKKPAKKAKK
jgi:hypothetical protein